MKVERRFRRYLKRKRQFLKLSNLITSTLITDSTSLNSNNDWSNSSVITRHYFRHNTNPNPLSNPPSKNSTHNKYPPTSGAPLQVTLHLKNKRSLSLLLTGTD